MKNLFVAIFFLMVCLLGGRAFANNSNDPEDILPLAKKIVADDKARFGIDVKKCRLECQRVYSEKHCIAKCAEISRELKAQTFNRESEERRQAEEQKPLIYKEAAKKYK